jgi:hypothetical protein
LPRSAACRASASHCCRPAASASNAKTSSRTPLTQAKRQPCTPKIATTRGTPAGCRPWEGRLALLLLAPAPAGLPDHVWTLREVLLFRVPPWPQPAGV